MGVKAFDVFATVIFGLIHGVYSEHILSCTGTRLGECTGSNQKCSIELKKCVCLRGFVMVDEECVDENLEPPSHSATVAVVTLFTLALIICGLVLVVRKYNLIEYVRQRINARRNNDVMYEDVMIGQDDPPLSP